MRVDPYFVRAAAQVGLSGPMLLFAPFAVPMGIFAVVHMVVSPDSVLDLGKAFIPILGSLGELGLVFSIFVPHDVLRARRWRRIGVTSLLGAGVVGVVVIGSGMALNPDNAYGMHIQGALYIIWLFGGPLVVAAWNIRSLLDQRPNENSA